MRHRKRDKKLGRTISHRKALLASLCRALIRDKRIRTTLPKAREACRLAEKLVTLARRGTLASRRQICARIRDPESVKALCDTIAPQLTGRNGGYTRIVKVGKRYSDQAPMVLVEWVGIAALDRRKKPKEETASSR